MILGRRQGYRKAFDNFDIKTVAGYDADKIDVLLADAGLVRNRLKIVSVVTNARAVLQIQDEFGSFDKFVWGFVDNKPIQNSWKKLTEIPGKTEISDKLNKALKKRGFKFIGTGICYSFMQAVGMVNDHTVDCFRYDEIKVLPH
jgi:DNA-3-methyladenine glycosylase I